MSFGSPFNRKNNDDDDDYKDDSFDENEDADSDGDSPARPTSGTASPFNRAAPASPFRSDPPRTGGFGSAPVNRNDPKPASSTNTNNPPPRAGVGANSPFGGNSSFNRSSDRNASDRNADDKAATGTKPPGSNTNNSNTNNPPRPNSPFGSNNPGSSSGNNPNNPPRPNNPGSGNNPGGTSGNAGGGSGFNRPAGSNPGSSSGSNPNNPARPNSPFGSNNPAGGSGSTPNTGNAGGGSGFNRPAGSNPAGSSGSNPNNPARPNSPFGGNNPGGSGSSTSNSGNTGGSRPIDDKSGGSKPAVPANVPARPGGGLFGGSRPADNKQNAPQGAQSQPDKKPDASSTPARPGGGLFGNRGNDQATDKKPDANAPAPARVGGLFGNRGKTDDQPADKKPDANAPAPARVGGLFGNRGKTDDQPADKKPDANAPAPERVGGLFGNRGKTDDQAADKKPDANPPAPARAGGLFGGFGKKADADAPKSDPAKPAANTGSRPAASTTSAPAFGTSPTKPPTFGSGSTPPSSGSAFGSKPAGGTPVGSSNPLSNKPAGASSTPYGSAFNKPTGAPVSSKPAAKAADAKQEVKPAGGLFGNLRSSIAGRMPGNAAMDDAKTARTADKKAPGKQARPLERKPKTVVVQRNFSQDHQLDIVGIALVLFGIVMFFGVISSNPNEGAITGGIVKLLSQLSGYGRYVWPIPCIAAGGWLILRHFRDEPPILEHHRLIGWIMLLLALMTTLQFAELLQKPVPTMAALAKISTEAWEKYGRGGGWIGDKLYMLIETMIGDAPTAVVLVGWWIVSVMLAFSITLAELTSYALSIVNWFSRARGGYVERRQQAMAAATLVTEATPTQVVGKTTVKAPALAAVNGGRKPAEIAANTVGSVPLATPIATPAAASAAPIGSTARGLFSRTPSQPVPVAEAVAIGSAAGQGVANVATPPPARSGFFGGRSTPSPPATETLQPNSNPLTPRPVKVGSTADNIADPSTSDKPAAPKASPAAGLFGSRPSMFGGGVPKVEDKAPDKVTDSKPVETPSDKPLDDKPAAPKSPVSGLFGGSRPSMFGGGAPKVEDKAPDKVADSKPVEALSDKPSDDKPAAPKSPVSGLFGGSRPAFSSSANNPPASQATPVSGLFGGSRPAFSSSANSPASQATPVKADDNAPSDDKPAAPKSPVSGLFGGSRPAFSSSANSSATSQPTPAKADDNAPSDDKPAVPKSPVSGMFGGSRPAFSSPANSPAASQPTPAKTDDNAPLDDKPAVPKAPVSGLFGSSRPAFSSSANSPAASQPTPAKTDDNAPLDDKPAVPKAASVPISTAAKPETPAAPVIVSSKSTSGYELPDYRELLEKGSPHEVDNEGLLERARVIEDTLQSFGAPGKVVEINSGPVITQFGVEPDYLVSRQGKKTRVKVSSIAKLDADLALSLAARSIRIEAPVPGKGYVGIEVPNAKTALVSLRDIMDSDAFGKLKSKLRIGLGQSVDGAPIAADLTAMPHLLIAGTTGSGKSVCVNAIITSLLLENTPDDLKFIMVDPKRVELTGYNAIPHLVAPVVVDLERIVGVLKWVTREMDDRYKRFSQVGARHIIDFNGKLPAGATKLPYLVVVIDELADLMMLAPDETEKVLTRLAQMARATGIHLIVSTQRPSVDVVTGLIKANFPARISFAVASSIDSRVILDQPGAEKLLGRGDMLYQAPDAAAPVRMQGVYVSDSEINRITRYWKLTKTGDTPYMDLNAPSSSFTSIANGKSTFDVTEPVQSRGEKFGNGGSNSASNGVPIGNGTPKPIGAPNGSMNAPVPSTTSATGSSTLFAARPTATNVAEADEDDEMYVEAVDLVKKMNNKASISLLQRKLRIGYTRAALLIELMKTRGVIDASNIADGQSVSDENA